MKREGLACSSDSGLFLMLILSLPGDLFHRGKVENGKLMWILSEQGGQEESGSKMKISFPQKSEADEFG